MPTTRLLICLALVATPACTTPGSGGDGSGGGSGTDNGDGVDDGPDGGGTIDDGDGDTGADTDGTNDGADDPDGGNDDPDGGSDGTDDDGGQDPLCGNGELDPGEDCDDGNRSDNDWCTAACQIATCGDSLVWDAAETCDDGNRQDGDGCAANCVLESCGDGVVDPGEQCDLGPNNGAHGALCSTACVSAGVGLSVDDTFSLGADDAYAREPNSLKTADFNNDGRVDVVTTNRSTGGSTVAYGLGDGSLWTPFSLPSGGRPTDAVAADFNDDGRPDIAVVAQTGTLLRVYLGEGRGVTAITSVALPVAPSSIAAGDVDGDGDTDLVIGNDDASSITIAVNDGNATFTVGNSSSTVAGGGGLNPHAVAIGDVSGDGIADIATANGGPDAGDVTVFVGIGDGAFGVATVYPVGGHALEDIVLADLNGDGALDVAAVASDADEATVLLAEAGGSLGVANDYPVNEAPVAIAVGDLDGDGALDIVTADSTADTVSILLGIAGGGTFELAESISVTVAGSAKGGQTGVGRDPTDIEVVDVDGDGHLDIVTANNDSKDVSVLLNDGNATFDLPVHAEVLAPYEQVSPNSTSSLAMADFNDDGRIDVAIADSYGESLDLVAGAGDGLFLPARTFHSGFGGNNARWVDTGDYDGDGRVEFVTSDHSGGGHHYGLQLAAGDFSWTSSGSSYAYAVAMGDVDGDGTDERFQSYYQSIQVFGSEESFSPVGIGAVAPFFLVATDATGDGLLDLLMTSPNDDSVILVAGTGGDAWGGPNPISTLNSDGGEGPEGLAVADLNGDDMVDLVTANADTGDLSVMLAQGNGSFAPALGIDVGLPQVQIERVAIGDFNGDLVPDIVAVGPGTETVIIAIGFGNGSFADPQSFPLQRPSLDVGADDLDGDGIDDLILTGEHALTVRVSDGHTVL